jgi:selenium metabolism protein YedF
MNDILTVDARGLACPLPVLETKRVLDEGGSQEFLVLVDNPASKENVARFARSQGRKVEIQERADGQFQIKVGLDTESKPDSRVEIPRCEAAPESSPVGKLVVYLGNNSMGSGDRALGKKLMRGFLRTWIDVDHRPWRMIFINSGVKLTTLDEESVEALSILAERGVEILSCRTCLDHFGLSDKLRVGRDTNMYEVIQSLSEAAKVISPD